MLIIGRDFHTGYPQIAMLDEATGEVVERRLDHLDGEAEAFYRSLPRPVRVGIEATGSIRWFQQLLTELGHELWVGHAAEIRARAVRQQKTDARDARHLLELLLSNRFPRIWVPSPEERDARQWWSGGWTTSMEKPRPSTRSLPRPVRVGIEATGSIRWFQQLLTELGHELWVGHAAEIRARAVRQQKTDARDARHLLELLLSNRFPRIWVPSPEERDARQLLRHRFQLVGFRTSVTNQLHALAMGQGVCQRKKLWSAKGRVELERLTLDPWAHRRRQASFPSPPPNPPPSLSASLLLLLVSSASLRLFSYLLPLTSHPLRLTCRFSTFCLFAFCLYFFFLALPLASCLLHLASCISPRPLGACSIFARCLSAILPTAR
jgi:transposase